MKKILLPLFILILTLCCLLSACSKTQKDNDNNSSGNSDSVSQTESVNTSNDVTTNNDSTVETDTPANTPNNQYSNPQQNANSSQINPPQNNDTLLGLQTHSQQEVQNAIRILSIGIYRIDSVGGVEPQVCWRNESQKAIKYIHFYLEPYNAVNDKVSCQISGQSITDCNSTGPFEESPKSQIDALRKINIGQDKYYIYDNDGNRWSPVLHSINEDKLIYTCWYDILQSHEITEENSKLISYFDVWNPIWYNNSVKSIKLCGIKIEYMDGTNMNINSTSAQYALC